MLAAQEPLVAETKFERLAGIAMTRQPPLIPRTQVEVAGQRVIRSGEGADELLERRAGQKYLRDILSRLAHAAVAVHQPVVSVEHDNAVGDSIEGRDERVETGTFHGRRNAARAQNYPGDFTGTRHEGYQRDIKSRRAVGTGHFPFETHGLAPPGTFQRAVFGRSVEPIGLGPLDTTRAVGQAEEFRVGLVVVGDGAVGVDKSGQGLQPRKKRANLCGVRIRHGTAFVRGGSIGSRGAPLARS